MPAAFNPQPFRLPPALPVQAVKTYAFSAPIATHFEDATAEEAQCIDYLHGWATILDENPDTDAEGDGRRRAHYIRHDATRQHREYRSQDLAVDYPQFANLPPGLTVFVFAPGQECFHQHHARNDRPFYYTSFGGDWRGRTTETQAWRAEDWVESFAEHQDRLARTQNQG